MNRFLLFVSIAVVFECCDSGDVECCPISESPECCMRYGGANIGGGKCHEVCDGMPLPEAEGWKIVTDKYGCPVWREPVNHTGCCGCWDYEDTEMDAGGLEETGGTGGGHMDSGTIDSGGTGGREIDDSGSEIYDDGGK